MLQCPDCKLNLPAKEETTTEVKTSREPPGLTKPKPTTAISYITAGIVNTYIQEP